MLDDVRNMAKKIACSKR